LENGADKETRNRLGCTSLHLAAFYNHSEVFDWLLNHSANIEAEIPATRETTLHLATKAKDPNCVKKLLAKGANPNAKMQKGYSALHIASSGQCADSSLVEELLGKGADIEATDDEGATAFHYAARDGLFDVVEVLLNHQANCGALNKQAQTPLHLAATNGHYYVCEIILEKNPKLVHSVSTLGYTPLHQATIGGHGEIIGLLIEHGANTENTDKLGFTPLHTSVYENQDKAFRVLFNAGANIYALSEDSDNILHAAALNPSSKMSIMFNNKKAFDKVKPMIESKNKSGSTPLHCSARSGNVEAVELLIKHGANIEEVTGIDGMTPLHLAAYANRTKVVEILLHKGANKEAKDSINLATPLHYASLFGYLEVVKLLVESGAKLDDKLKTGFTPLACAAKEQCSFVVEYLLSKGANPISQNDKSLTPFHWAAIKGNLTIMQLLVGECADGLDLKDNLGRTPFDCANDSEHWEVAKYIEEHKVHNIDK
jgi:ankyrin repeat protein